MAENQTKPNQISEMKKKYPLAWRAAWIGGIVLIIILILIVTTAIVLAIVVIFIPPPESSITFGDILASEQTFGACNSESLQQVFLIGDGSNAPFNYFLFNIPEGESIGDFVFPGGNFVLNGSAPIFKLCTSEVPNNINKELFLHQRTNTSENILIYNTQNGITGFDKFEFIPRAWFTGIGDCGQYIDLSTNFTDSGIFTSISVPYIGQTGFTDILGRVWSVGSDTTLGFNPQNCLL